MHCTPAQMPSNKCLPIEWPQNWSQLRFQQLLGTEYSSHKKGRKKKKRLNFLDIDYTCVAKVFYQLQNLGVTSSNIEQSLLF